MRSPVRENRRNFQSKKSPNPSRERTTPNRFGARRITHNSIFADTSHSGFPRRVCCSKSETKLSKINRSAPAPRQTPPACCIQQTAARVEPGRTPRVNRDRYRRTSKVSQVAQSSTGNSHFFWKNFRAPNESISRHAPTRADWLPNQERSCH